MPSRPRLLVLGGGFGGYSLLSRLPRGLFDATLVSPRNYFLFNPLLPSAISGTVELRSILEPVRRRLRRVRVVEAAAQAVDWERKLVSCQGAIGGEALEVAFDLLVIAVGAGVADYGIPGVAQNAVPFTRVEDARSVRRRILEQLARADLPGLAEAQVEKQLTFVVCGGGPTGVEVAAEIHDLLQDEITDAYPELGRRARVLLIEARERILSGFDEALAEYARRHFRRDGVELRLSTAVTAVEPGRVVLATGESIECGLVVWAGGNRPVGFVAAMEEAKGPGGRLRVDGHLRLVARPDAYAVGDCAAAGEPPFPATAQVAQQEGEYLARALGRRARGLETPPFRFRSSGMLAYIGGGRALADLPNVKWSGRTAWIFWRSVYLTKLVSTANKVKVLFDWLKARLFGRDLSRF